MSYCDKYPSLRAFFSYYSDETFERIGKVIEENLSDLFNLSVLNRLATDQFQYSSYVDFFDKCCVRSILGKNEGQLDESTIKTAMILALNAPETQAWLCTHHVMTPTEAKSPTMGLIEKIVSGRCSSFEALTPIDLFRTTKAIRGDCGVYSLKTLTGTRENGIDSVPYFIPENNTFFFVNLTENPKKPAKWACVHRNTDDHIFHVYCEAALLESEKRALENQLMPWNHDSDIVYSGGTADASAISTGYTALAYANTLRPFGNFSVDADFSALLQTVIKTQEQDINNEARIKFDQSYYNPQEATYYSKEYRDLCDHGILNNYSFHSLAQQFVLGVNKAVEMPSDEELAFITVQEHQIIEQARATIDRLQPRVTANAPNDRDFIETWQSQIAAARQAIAAATQKIETFKRDLQLRFEQLRLAIHQNNLADAIIQYNALMRLIGYKRGDLEQKINRVINRFIIDPLKDENKRSFIPGLFSNEALALCLNTENDRVNLIITEQLLELIVAVRDVAIDRLVYQESLDATATQRNPRRDIATGIVLNVFRGQAKKRQLAINIPAGYALHESELMLILRLMANNPYVTELQIDEADQSFHTLQRALSPILARNQWLQLREYKPPMAADFWQEAVKHWLLYLKEMAEGRPTVAEQQAFQACVNEMGLEGLQAMTRFLADRDNADLIKQWYGEIQPAFYAGIPRAAAQNMPALKAYLHTLSEHLQQARQTPDVFPFREFRMEYMPVLSENINDVWTVFSALNRIESVEKITLINDAASLEYSYEALMRFFDLLIQARDSSDTLFVKPIAIPALDTTEALSPRNLLLRQSYIAFNTQIEVNRRYAENRRFIDNIRAQRNKRRNQDDNPLVVQAALAVEVDANEAVENVIQLAIQDIEKITFKRDGSAILGGLQQQQQQQQQQQRAVQQEVQQNVQQNVIVAEEVALPMDLLTYESIAQDQLFCSFFNQFLDENPDIAHLFSAVQGNRNAKIQHFFKTIISAKPNEEDKKVSYVIHAMTRETAKMLLRHYQHLSSGLNPNNLPKGFYTQRSKDGDLVLCYSADHVSQSEEDQLPFQLNFEQQNLPLQQWRGSSQQLFCKAGSYDLRGVPSATKLEKLMKRALFALFQPDYGKASKDAKEAALDVILASAGVNIQKDNEQYQDIVQYWDIFKQYWDEEGAAGIKRFLSREIIRQVSLFDNAYTAMFKFLTDLKFTDTTLIEVAQNYIGDDQQKFCKLGQIFYLYGETGVEEFFITLQEVQTKLGPEFYAVFTRHFLDRTENFNSLMPRESAHFFETMTDMVETLNINNPQNTPTRKMWLTILQKHMSSVGWDRIDRLWHAYKAFLAVAAKEGVVLREDTFDFLLEEDYPAENMFVFLDRKQLDMRCLHEQEAKQQYLDTLRGYEHKHGDVHGALVYEKFKRIDQDLHLYDFQNGTPTYKPDLANLYDDEAVGNIVIQRAIASADISPARAQRLMVYFSGKPNNTVTKDKLILCLHTRCSDGELEQILGEPVNDPESDECLKQAWIAYYIHTAVYRQKQPLSVDFAAMQHLIDNDQIPATHLVHWLQQYPQGTVLEAASIFFRFHQDAGGNINGKMAQLCTLFNSNITEYQPATQKLILSGIKLAALFHKLEQNDSTYAINAYFQLIHHLPPAIQEALESLITRLLSIENEQTPDALVVLRNIAWNSLIVCINNMNGDPGHAKAISNQYFLTLNRQGIRFKYAAIGDFRKVGSLPEDADKPEGLNVLIDHEQRVWAFMQQRLAVEGHENAQRKLANLVALLTQLQRNSTTINEVEPLLATLENAESRVGLWSVEFLTGLLYAIQPKDKDKAFPTTLLKVILQEEALLSKENINDLAPVKVFPPVLAGIFERIINETQGDSALQTLLCQFALREFQLNPNVELAVFPEILNFLRALKDINLDVRKEILRNLLKYDDVKKYSALSDEERRSELTQLSQKIRYSQILLDNSSQKTVVLGLKALNRHYDSISKFFDTKYDQERITLLFHILVWSTFDKNPQQGFNHPKTQKLLAVLNQLNVWDLKQIAACYPHQPSPNATNLLRLLKQHKQERHVAANVSVAHAAGGYDVEAAIAYFKTHSDTTARADYGQLPETRDFDLQRMMTELRVTLKGNKENVTSEQLLQLSTTFAYLKRLERGEALIGGQRVRGMDEDTLREHYRTLAKISHPTSEQRAQLWALLFEAARQKTEKYPHMAQQFALIAGDICITAKKSVLQLSTGEGKSLSLALLAARDMGADEHRRGKIFAGKQSLAKRDADEFKDFFDFLGISSGYVHAGSPLDELNLLQIQYTTLADLSNALTAQQKNGTPVTHNKEQWFGYIDEFDFVRFEEEHKSTYNQACAIKGNTPKKMHWFYDALIQFYENKREALEKPEISQEELKAILVQLCQFLYQAARPSLAKKAMIDSLTKDAEGIQALITYLQAVVDAHTLQRGNHYMMKAEEVQIGNETYPLRRLIPLTSDSQPVDAAFSNHVHQTLAEIYNRRAKLNQLAPGEDVAQNFYVPSESEIISSQVASHCIHTLLGQWRGATGTITPVQAKILNADADADNEVQILHVPTNQRNLRAWHRAFFDDKDAADAALIANAQEALAKGESPLFACENDIVIGQLKRLLEVNFDRDVISQQMIFYMTDGDLSAEEVIAKKRKMEHSADDKKAVFLIASGLGRGDNPEVRRVLPYGRLLNKSDEGQKGGRTARNGEQGDVYEFFVTDKLIQEEQGFQDWLEAKSIEIPPHFFPEHYNNLTQADKEALLDRVLYLREYQSHINNSTNQCYRVAVAEFSTWAMQCCCDLKQSGASEEEQEGLEQSMIRAQTAFQRKWLEICSSDKSDLEKISDIRKFIQLKVTGMSDNNRDIAFIQTNFILSPPALEMPTSTSPTLTDRALAKISVQWMHVMNNHSGVPLSDEDVKEIAAQLESIAQNATMLHHFAEKIGACDSVEKFQEELTSFMMVMSHLPQDASGETLSAAASSSSTGRRVEKAVVVDELSVNEQNEHLLRPLMLAFAEQGHWFYKTIATVYPQVFEQLTDLASNEIKIEKYAPLFAYLFEYLSKFGLEEQKQWHKEYVTQLDVLIREIAQDQVHAKAFFANSSPMPLPQLMTLWRLAKQKDFDVALIQKMDGAVRVNPEIRFRLFNTCAQWMNDGVPEAASNLFEHFYQAMTALNDSDLSRQVFDALVKKTSDWWMQGSGKYQEDLRALWAAVAKHGVDNNALSEIISWEMTLDAEGKSWIYVLKNMLETITPENLARISLVNPNAGWRARFWAASATESLKKSDQLTVFQGKCHELNVFVSAIHANNDPQNDVGRKNALINLIISEIVQSEGHSTLLLAQKKTIHLLIQMNTVNTSLQQTYNIIRSILLFSSSENMNVIEQFIQDNLSTLSRNVHILEILFPYPAPQQLNIDNILALGKLLVEIENNTALDNMPNKCTLGIPENNSPWPYVYAQLNQRSEPDSTKIMDFMRRHIAEIIRNPEILIGIFNESTPVSYNPDYSLRLAEIRIKAKSNINLNLSDADFRWFKDTVLRDLSRNNCAWMMKFIESNLEQIICKPKVLVMISLMFTYWNNDISIEQQRSIEAIATLLLTDDRVPENFGVSLNALNPVAFWAHQMNTLVRRQIAQKNVASVIEFLRENLTLIFRHPRIFDLLLMPLQAQLALPYDNAKKIGALACFIATNAPVQNAVAIDALLQKLMPYATLSLDTITQLEILIKAAPATEIDSILSMNHIHIVALPALAQNADPNQLNANKKKIAADQVAMTLFYQNKPTLQIAVNLPAPALGHPAVVYPDSIQQLFQFEENSERQAQRLSLMRRLYQGTLVSPVENVNNAWTSQQNRTLLQKGFDEYIKYISQDVLKTAQKGLAAAPVPITPDVMRKRDLTAEQQGKLLTTLDELKQISEINPMIAPGAEASDTEDKITALRNELTAQSQAYLQVSSGARRRRLGDFITQIQGIGVAQGVSRYEAILDRIQVERQNIILQDTTDNSGRWFTTLHSQGISRYLNTLNQMEDAVLRHWTKDNVAVKTAHRYLDKNKSILNDAQGLVAKLLAAVNAAQVTYATKFSGFFHGGYLPVLARCRDLLITYQNAERALVQREAVPLTEAAREAIKNERRELVEQLATELNKDTIHTLPGHIITLVDQVVDRAKGIEAYLSKRPRN